MFSMNEDALTKVCSRKDCSSAGIPQTLDKFSKNIGGKYGVRSVCKVCCKKYHNDYAEELKEQKKLYYQVNKKEIKERSIQYHKIHKEEISLYKKQYYRENKEEIREYRQKNKEKAKECRRQYIKRRTKEDINFRIVCNLRSRLRMALKNNQKSCSAIPDLMMSVADFKIYLEERFYPNPDSGEIMTWENYGYRGWHIDHIIPLSAFDLANREEFLKAVHYSNLRPMWAKRNMSEGDRGLSLNKRERRI